MDHPLYGAALYLNPGKFHPLIKKDDDATIGQLRGCFLDVLARMVEDEETRLKINAQAMNYEYLRGDAFSNKMAKENLKSMGPRKCSFYILIFSNVHYSNLIPASNFQLHLLIYDLHFLF